MDHKRPKLWNGPHALGEGLVRGLELTGAPYLSARAGDVYAGVMQGKGEVKFGKETPGDIVFTPGYVLPGNLTQINSFGPPFVEDEGEVNPPLGTEYADAYAYTNRTWWVNRDPSWIARSGKTKVRLTKGHERKYGGRNWVSDNERVVLSWAGPSTRSFDAWVFQRGVMQEVGINGSSLLVYSASVAELLPLTLRNKVHHLFPDTLIYRQGVVVLDLIEKGLATYSSIMFGTAGTTTATAVVMGAAIHRKPDGSSVLRFVVGNGYAHSTAYNKTPKLRFYEVGESGAGTPLLLGEYDITPGLRLVTDWYFNAAGDRAVATFSSTNSETLSRVVEWSESGFSTLQEPVATTTLTRTTKTTKSGSPDAPPTALGQQLDVELKIEVTVSETKTVEGRFIYADYAGPKLVFAKFSTTQETSNSSQVFTKSCRLSAASTTGYSPYYWSEPLIGDYTAVSSSTDVVEHPNFMVGDREVLAGGTATTTGASNVAYSYYDDPVLGAITFTASGGGTTTTSVEPHRAGPIGLFYVDARYKAVCVFAGSFGYWPETRETAVSGTSLTTTATAARSLRLLAAGVWGLGETTNKEWVSTTTNTTLYTPPKTTFFLGNSTDETTDTFVSTQRQVWYGDYGEGFSASSASTNRSKQGALAAMFDTQVIASGGASERAVGSALFATTALEAKLNKLMTRDTSVIDHISRI